MRANARSQAAKPKGLTRRVTRRELIGTRPSMSHASFLRAGYPTILRLLWLAALGVDGAGMKMLRAEKNVSGVNARH
jgi:hypothetical protein